MAKKVSIITICFNSEATLEDTIKSVVSQNYPHIEYIIIDGASKDGTMRIVSQYEKQIATVVSEPDKGIYDAMNKGVSLATGDIVGILNSDDFYASEDVISHVAEKFEADGELKGLYADLCYVDQADTERIVRYWKSGQYKKGAFLKGWMPPHPTLFVKKEVYDMYGSYNLKLRSAADYEFMLRVIHKEEIALAYLPMIITKMRTGGQSNVTLANRWKANQEDREAWRINELSPSWTTMLRKPLGKIKQYWQKP